MGGDHIEASMTSLALDEEGPMPFEELEINAVLGKGNFGQVFKAEYCGTEVAVKEVCQFANV